VQDADYDHDALLKIGSVEDPKLVETSDRYASEIAEARGV